MNSSDRVPLISTARQRFEGKQLMSGTPFTASPDDAADLFALHLATPAAPQTYADATLTAEPIPAPVVRTKRHYRRRDMKARG